MSSFETSAPKYSRKTFEETDEQLKTTQDSISGDMSTAELVAAAQKKEGLEQKKTGLHEQAREMATEEDVERSFAEAAKQKEERKQEHIVSPEQLQESVKMLEANIAKMDKIPESVLRSPEGQEATQSLMERMTGKLAGFREGVAQKLATLDSWEGRERMAKVLTGTAFAAVLGPVVLQMARSKWPEVGVALDAAPEALQQFIHLDVWAKITELLGNNDLVQNGSIWKNGGIEVSNLLVDLSSGKETLDSLAPDQLQVLQEGMNTEDFKVLTSPYLDDPARYARAVDSTVPRAFGNMGPIGAAGIGMYGVMSKIGALANKYKKETI